MPAIVPVLLAVMGCCADPCVGVAQATNAEAGEPDRALPDGAGASGNGTAARRITCRPEEPALGVLDSAQAAIYRALCGTTLWFDGFFGEPTLYEGAGETYGRINLGGYWSERDGFEPKIRLRARVSLPALQNRAKLLVGLGNAEALVDGTADSYSEATDQRFIGDEDDDELLIGFGYSASERQRRGFDLEAGVKVNWPLNPYVGVNYRWYERLGDDWYLRLRLRGFWLREEQFGTSFTSSIDYSVTTALLLRWANFSKVSGETQGVEWRNRLTAFQRVDNDHALSYSVFARGETKQPVSLRDYGLELRFRRRTFRQWFFIEWVGGLSWPQETVEEARRLDPQVGMEFEMHFGKRRSSAALDPASPAAHGAAAQRDAQGPDSWSE